MGGSRNLGMLSALALCLAVVLVPAAAMAQDAGDKAIATRQGYMKLVLWEAGPLFGMAKGEMAYDAKTAEAHAANLKIIASYPVGTLFTAGTSNADYGDKTRSLPKIWEDQSGFTKALTDWQAAVGALGGQVGQSQEALAAAVSEMGKTCGGCHKPYRAEKK